MPTYSYKARSAKGKAVKGVMDAAAKDEVVDKLRRMGYMATHVAEAKASVKPESVFERFRKVSTGDMVMFNVQLSNMIGAGISILAGLETLSRQLENKKLREAVGSIKKDIEAGDSFSQALAKHPGVFPALFVNMVKAGEASGKLDTVLARYAEFFEHNANLKEKVKSALLYPAILLIAGISVTLFIITFVIPQFAQIFMKTGISLPMPTQILYKAGMAIKHFWHLGVLLAVIASLGINYYKNTDKGRLNLDGIKLKLPFFGSLHRRVAVSRFARTLGTLVASGVPILQSLDVVGGVVENRVLADALSDVRSSVEKGQRIAEPMKMSGEFPPDTVQMVSVGEESGELDRMLNKISDFYDMSIRYTIDRLTSIIEPLFLLIMGGMVGFIMASMLLPIFDMIGILRR